MADNWKTTAKVGGEEPPPRCAVQRQAAIREIRVRFTVVVGGGEPARLTSLPRLVQCLAFALLLSTAGCRKRPDLVMASFVNAEFNTNRIVLYTSGKYECYGANDDGQLRNRPYETGIFVGGVSNYVVSIEQGVFDSPAMRARKVYRIIKHAGAEYLFDELGNAVKKFEETKDERELRHAWRREGANKITGINAGETR